MARQRRKTDDQIAHDMARSMLPASQARKREFVLVGVSNHSDADQRHMVRSGQKKTIRRKTHIERMVERGQLTKEQGLLCEWYARQHEMGYATVGCTANYGGTGGGGFGSHDLLARYTEQAVARINYATARQALGMLASLFERIVIGQTHLAWGQRHRSSRLHLSFDLAVRKLDEAVGHLVEIPA